MLSTNLNNMLKNCLFPAVLAIFSQVGFAQQVLVIPSQSINISDLSENSDEEAIAISTQNILGSENYSIAVSIQVEVTPAISAPVIKVDNVLYATNGDLIFKKESSHENWVISSLPDQSASVLLPLTQSVDNLEKDGLTNSPSPVSELSAFEGNPGFSSDVKFKSASKNELPADFPFLFSLEITSVFFQDNSASRLDVILGNDIQISFTKEGTSWVASDWFVLGSSDPSSVNSHNRAGPPFLINGLLSGSFSFVRTYSVTSVTRLNDQNLSPSRLDSIPAINHIASGWTPTVGSVYDRNSEFNLIFCSYLQTFSSFYSSDFNFSTISSRLPDQPSPRVSITFDSFGLSGSLFKGTLT